MKNRARICIENRARILVEILKGIRANAEKLHITVKINCNDFTFGGNTEQDCVQICRMLDEEGIDSIEVSGNGTSVGGIIAHVNEAYFAPAAELVAEAVNCPVIVVGGFRSQDTMEEVINNSKIELISLSRPLLREPDLPLKMQTDNSYVSKCVSCNRCYSSDKHKCIFRGRD